MHATNPYLMLLAMLVAAPATAQVTTAFTYQGELEQSSSPADGEFDFQFALFDDALDGLRVAGPINAEDIFVDGGLFATEVDFGPNVFGMMDLWLEVRVREGDSEGEFTPLLPRQKLNPAPMAQHALNVEVDAIGSAQIRSDSITGSKISAGAVGSAQIDDNAVQRRVSGSCGSDKFVSEVRADGTVVCRDDSDITEVTAGSGLTGGASSGSATLAVDSSTMQNRVTGTCPPGLKMAGINADGSVACEVLPMGVAWIADAPTDGGLGVITRSTSIATRASGNPIVSYYHFNAGVLKVYDCADAACSSGTVRILDEGDGNRVGGYTSIAVRASGNPIISYWDESAENLKLFDCTNAACSSGAVRILDDGGRVGRYTSIAVGASGNPIISYLDVSNGALKVYDCADAGCSSGAKRILDDGGGDSVGRHTSITIRDSGNPIISYQDSTNGALKVYDCVTIDCSSPSGAPRTLDDGGIVDVGLYTSIAVLDSGNPIISYYDRTNGALKAYRCFNTACSSGTDMTLDDGGGDSVGEYSSLTVRDNGNPIISYRGNGTLKIYDCTNSSCTSGAARTVDSGSMDDGSGGSIGSESSIAVRASGLPIISYYDSPLFALKVFSCGDPNCAR